MAIVRSFTLTITLCLAWLTATGAAQDTSLFIAARTASPQEIQATINAGFNVNAQDQYGQTPLMYAAAGNTNPDAVSVLVNAGANVNASTPAGWTALMFAARDNPNRAVAARLFELGADLDARNNEGMRAEDYAVARSSFNASAATTTTTANTGMPNMNTGMAGTGTTMTSTGLTQLPSSFSRQRAINYYSPAGNTMGASGMGTSGMGMSGTVTPATSMSAAQNASWQNPAAHTAANNRAYTMASNLPSRLMTRAPTDITIPTYTSGYVTGQAMSGQAMTGQYMTPSGQMAYSQANTRGLAQTNNFYTPTMPQANSYTPMQTSNIGFTNISGVGQRQYYGTRLGDSFAGNYAPNNVIYGTQPATTLRNINQPVQTAQQPITNGGSGVIMTSTGMQNINRMNENMFSQAPGQGIATPLFDIPANNGVQPPAQVPTESAPPARVQRTQNRQLLTQPSRLLYGPNAGMGAQPFYYQPYALTYTASYGRQYNQMTPVNEQIAPNDLSPCVNINRAAAPALLQIVHINSAAQVADITVERGYQLFSSVDELAARVDGIGAAQMADIRAQGLACIIFE